MSTDIEQTAYDALVGLVEARPDDLDFAVLVATFAAASGIENGRGCDGCDRIMVEDIFDVAGFRYAHAVDGNGDPDVSICPACIADDEQARADEMTAMLQEARMADEFCGFCSTRHHPANPCQEEF